MLFTKVVPCTFILAIIFCASICAAQCPADDGLNNGSFEAATVVELPYYRNFLTICSDLENDYFAVNVTQVPTVLQFFISFTSPSVSLSDLDIRIYDASETWIDTALSVAFYGEAGEMIVSTAGLYYVRIYPIEGKFLGVGRSYELSLSTRPLPLCVPDALESNDAFLTAKPIGVNTELIDYTMCPQDYYDYYTIAVPVMSSLQIRLTLPAYYPTAGVDLDLILYDQAMTIIDESYGFEEELIEVTVGAGEYFILVENLPGWKWATNYSLFVVTTFLEDTSPTTSQVIESSTETESSTSASSTATVTSDQNIVGTSTESSGGSSAVLVVMVVLVCFFLCLISIVLVAVALLFLKRPKQNEHPDVAQGGVFELRESEQAPEVQTTPAVRSQYDTIVDTSQRGNNYSMTPKDVKPVAASAEKLPTIVTEAPKQSLLDYEELENMRKIGEGSYGVVYKAKWRETPVAVKELHSDLIADPKALSDFKGEADLLKKLRPHPNVVLFLGITAPPQPVTIITEFCSNGSLYAYIHSDEEIDENMQKRILLGIARGMLHLHSENIIHRDLAARNVLLTESFDVKVSDFGLSRQKQDNLGSNKTKSDIGPLKWMSPESIRDKSYSPASDVWAFGVVMWELLARTDPYPDLDPMQTAMRVAYEDFTLTAPQGSDASLAEMMKTCFKKDMNLRPSFKAICTNIATEEIPSMFPRAKTPTSSANRMTAVYDAMDSKQSVALDETYDKLPSSGVISGDMKQE